MEKVDGRLVRGDQTRRAVLRRSVDIASVDGLEGLSIGRLATELGISKSGLFAHFGSKEELQLATIRAARRIYADEVVTPAFEVEPGLGRVWAISESWLDYSSSRVFPGGCFFQKVSHEYAGRDGAVHDALIDVHVEWMTLIEETVQAAVDSGEIDADANQLAFDLNAYYEAANFASILHDDGKAYDRARQAIRSRLESVVVAGTTLPW
ncbi:TetR/AcrR family transcriptional regulator [Kribbella pittospori]|uniref:TetR/AcrR family transcriptional regulator n=1 Tax=Kribbella pittospori TaxID=722689 RepID=A0A4V2MC58_9ACTN|nr:TetR/AcrR family transcriptional regulator [Kribbella pittospori]TCC65642.1 TetR/AcrR family transcriptional regulator [Kribbella pittospori]